MSDLSKNLQKNEEMVLDAKMHWIALFVHPIRYLTTELSLSTKRVVGKFGFVKIIQRFRSIFCWMTIGILPLTIKYIKMFL